MPANTTAYYDQTADRYDLFHSDARNPEHVRALEQSWAIMRMVGVGSVLDVGCGTGRSLTWLAEREPALALYGVDPSRGQLSVARERVPEARLSVGDGERLDFPDGRFDLVMASGIMHHVERPDAVLREMFRVSRLGVLVSDHNNLAFGRPLTRRLRLLLHATGLLGAATFVKQGFRRQGYSDADGWWYPFSLFDQFGTLAEESTHQFVFPTRPAHGPRLGNLVTDVSHFAALALKPEARWAMVSQSLVAPADTAALHAEAA